MVMKAFHFLRTALDPLDIVIVVVIALLIFGPMLVKKFAKLKNVLNVAAVALIAALLVLVGGKVFKWDPTTTYLIAGLLVMTALVIYGVRWYLQYRREKAFEAGLMQQAQSDMERASVARRGEMENLLARWKESVRVLRESNVGGRNVIYTLPWFAIIGEPQSGKTTLLRNSGLDFPVGDAAIHGIGGTKNCDWWFANEAVVLDTAGRYAFEVQRAPDQEEWERFLGLLKKTRKNTPINGLLVTVPTDSLLKKTEDEVRVYAQHLRGKVNDLIMRLGIVFPVYLVVTKVDLVEGFVSFFNRYPADRVREAVGRTFTDVRAGKGIEHAYKTLDDLYDRLCSMSLGLMEEEDPGAPARPYLTFPEEFRTLAGKLRIFLEALFRENIYMQNPAFRGFYITSGTQEGRTISSAFAQMAQNLGVDSERLTTQHGTEGTKRAYFVRDLLSRILIDDGKRGLVRPVNLGPRQQIFQAFRRVLGPAAAAALIFFVWAIASYSSNRSDWDGLKASVGKCKPWLDSSGVKASSTPEITQALADLSELSERHERAATDRSALLNLFLTRSDPSHEVYEARFRQAVERSILSPIFGQTRATLEAGPGGIARSDAYMSVLRSFLAYRAAIGEAPHDIGSRVEGLLDPAADRLGLYPRRQEFGSVMARYLEAGGRETGDVDFAKVAAAIRGLLTRLQGTDPMFELRMLANEAAPVVAVNRDSEAIEGYWNRLKEISKGRGLVAVSPSDLEAMSADVGRVPGAEAVRDALRQLSAFAAEPESAKAKGAAPSGDALRQNVLGPLKAAVDEPVPPCPPLDPGSPESVDAITAEIAKFSGRIGTLAGSVRQGIDAINAGPFRPDPILAGTVESLIKNARTAEMFEACSQGWFDVGGPLSAGTLLKAAGGGGGGQEQVIGPPGRAFECPQSVAAAAGDVDTGAIDKLEAPLGKLMSLPGLPEGARGPMKERWSGNKGTVKGGKGGAYRTAVARIELAKSPSSWTLEGLPDELQQIAADNSLKDILTAIRNGLVKEEQDTSFLKSFNHEAYLNAINEIAQKLKQAAEDGTGLGFVKYANEVFLANNPTPFDRALIAAEGAPDPGLKATLKSIPTMAWKKLLEAAPARLDGFYKQEVRTKVRDLLGCYPFAPSGKPCDPKDFSAVFGHDGSVAKLVGFASGESSGPRKKYGESLPIGSGFQRFLRSAARIYEVYGAGGKSSFNLEFDAQPAQLVPEGKQKPDDFIIEIPSITLTLGGADIEYANDRPTKKTVEVPLQDGAVSRLYFELKDARGKKLTEKLFGSPLNTQKLEVGKVDEERGAWSFVKFLQKASSGEAGGCCTWEVPLVRKDKKAERVGKYRLVFKPVGQANVGDPRFWKLDAPPESVTD